MTTRTEVEQRIASKRRERELYVSPHGVAKCHAEIDSLLDEWEQADVVGREADHRSEVPD